MTTRKKGWAQHAEAAFDRKVKETLEVRDWKDLEALFLGYGLFLEQVPGALVER